MHQKIGILGGMSPESTVTYYEHITRTYTARFGDYGYPEILIYSVNFQAYVEWQKEGRWAEAARAMADSLERLRRAGADFGLIATNTMHIVFDKVQAAVGMPLVSIVDATAAAVRAAGCRRVGLLGTVFTMREHFFRGVLSVSASTFSCRVRPRRSASIRSSTKSCAVATFVPHHATCFWTLSRVFALPVPKESCLVVLRSRFWSGHKMVGCRFSIQRSFTQTQHWTTPSRKLGKWKQADDG